MRIPRLPALACAGLLLSSPTAIAESAPAAPCKSTVSGDLRLHELQSQVFGNKRTIRVLLPPGYDAAENSAPTPWTRASDSSRGILLAKAPPNIRAAGA